MEGSRGLFVVFEVSTCGEDRVGCVHVRIVGCDMLFLVVACVFLQSNLCFCFLVPKRSVRVFCAQ